MLYCASAALPNGLHGALDTHTHPLATRKRPEREARAIPKLPKIRAAVELLGTSLIGHCAYPGEYLGGWIAAHITDWQFAFPKSGLRRGSHA